MTRALFRLLHAGLSLSFRIVIVKDGANPDYKSGDDLRALLKAKVPPMVQAGTLEKAAARDNAMAAAKCLRLK